MIVKSIIKLIRVKQWVKNLFVMAPLLFSLKFAEPLNVINSLIAFFTFCFASSSIYVINDMIDRNRDALHPVKKFRPIASGKISIKNAWIIELFMLSFALLGLLYLHNYKVIITIALYLLTNILYSLKLKDIAVIDVLVIALGFVLRVYAGAYAINTPVSNHIFTTTLFISLFLGFTKRKQEILKQGNQTRRVLKEYSVSILNSYIDISASLTIMSYALYTLEKTTVLRFGTNRLIYSIIFVVYGLFKYAHILDKNPNAEDPTDNVLSSKELILACFLYVFYLLLLFAKII